MAKRGRPKKMQTEQNEHAIIEESIEITTQSEENKQVNETSKYLKGLVYHYSMPVISVGSDGWKKRRYIAKERPLTVDDLLSIKDEGDTLKIVTKNGKKYTIKKY